MASTQLAPRCFLPQYFQQRLMGSVKRGSRKLKTLPRYRWIFSFGNEQKELCVITYSCEAKAIKKTKKTQCD